MPPSARKTAIIPTPASGLSVVSKIVQPFLSPVLKIEEIFSVFCCSKQISETLVTIRALRNPRDHK